MKRAQKQQQEYIKKEKFQRQQFVQLLPKNEKQKDLIEALKYSTLVIAEGSAGVGKTMLVCWYAAKRLFFGDIKKIVLTRAYQPLAGRSIGFLPGSLEEKLYPYYKQMLDYFDDFLGKGSTEIHLKQGTIELCSLETIRGRSWSDTIVIVDEAQSLLVPEIQALVTRIGDNAQMVFCGDDSGMQTDVRQSMNGLTYLRKLVDRYGIKDTSFVHFSAADIVRSGMVKSFVIAFEEEAMLDQQGKAIISSAEQDKQFRKQR